MKHKYTLIMLAILTILISCQNHKKNLAAGIILKELENLPFSSFLDESFYSLLKTYPELVTEYGMDTQLGMTGTELNSYDESFLKERIKLEDGILEILENYDTSIFSENEIISYSIYKEYMKDLVAGHQFRHNEYLLSYMITSVNISTEQFFTEIIPITSSRDAEKYIQRLQAVDKKMEEVDTQLQIQQELGITLPSSLIPPTLNTIRAISRNKGSNTSFYMTLKQKIDKLGLSQDEIDVLLEEAEAACNESVIPGYKRLEERLIAQQKISVKKTGVGTLPDGLNYYNYALSHHTNSDLSAREIHDLGIEELERIHRQMRLIFGELGYETDQDIENLYNLLERDDSPVTGAAIVETHKELIDDARQWMDQYFPGFPRSEVVVKEDQIGGYYIPPSFDGSRPGTFYASTGSVSYFTLPTLTFHETYPGHHYQIALTAEMDIPFFQRQAWFTGYLEGWALYAEYLMAETGYYENDPFGRLGHLQAEAFRAARLVVDTGLHIYDWDIGKASLFFSENTGFSKGFSQNQIYRYLVWPGQAASYYTGYMEFKNLLKSEQTRLANKFNYVEFHRKVLANGPMPLTLLKNEIFRIE
jgi:uncharacterized protein (DUF885 family)